MTKQFMKMLKGGACWIWGETDLPPTGVSGSGPLVMGADCLSLLHGRQVVLDVWKRVVEVMKQAFPFLVLR